MCLFPLFLFSFCITRAQKHLEGEEPSLENRGGEGGGDCNTPMLTTTALPLQNVFHCTMSLDQLYFARPVPLHSGYRSPLRGLYLCGSGAHPGE